jgi:copper chaperone CopZ
MTIETYRVEGMTCAHCAGSVTREVRGVDGVADATVDLDGGTVTVSSPDPLDESAIARAVAEAGYTFAGRS